MKIDIEIPDNFNGATLYLVTRSELVAKKDAGDPRWHIKSVRCGRCGNCCRVHPKSGAYFKTKPDGSCIHLQEDGNRMACIAGMAKPLACVVGEPEGAEYAKFGCCIEWDK
jgi:hypothetical protein